MVWERCRAHRAASHITLPLLAADLSWYFVLFLTIGKGDKMRKRYNSDLVYALAVAFVGPFRADVILSYSFARPGILAS